MRTNRTRKIPMRIIRMIMIEMIVLIATMKAMIQSQQRETDMIR